MTLTDVVATAEEAMRLERPALLVLEPLAEVLDAHGIGQGELLTEPIGEGHSNVTFAVRRTDARVVVRRPPRPPYPASAHDVLREARLLRRLHAAGVPVPAVLVICEDPAPIGAPFYVMEHIEGHVVSESLPAALATPDAGRRIAEAAVDALVDLHAVDPVAAGLDIRRGPGYLERQLRRFGEIWADRRTREVPDVDRAAGWLTDHLPEQADVTVVHGDFRLGNLMLGPAPPPRVDAILDWEMATVGDPLADLGYLVATWAEPDDEETPMLALSRVTRSPAFPGRDALRERYAARAGRDVSGLRWHEVLALWKSAVFLEASYARYREGTTNDPYFASLGDGVPAIGRAAVRRMDAPDRPDG